LWLNKGWQDFVVTVFNGDNSTPERILILLFSVKETKEKGTSPRKYSKILTFDQENNFDSRLSSRDQQGLEAPSILGLKSFQPIEKARF
jgi:hypothetical protein